MTNEKLPHNGFLKFIEQNAWGLIIALIALVSFYTLTNYRLTKAEQKIDEYPSVDYFDLKFKVIDQNFTKLEQKIADHISE